MKPIDKLERTISEYVGGGNYESQYNKEDIAPKLNQLIISHSEVIDWIEKLKEISVKSDEWYCIMKAREEKV